MHYCYYHILCSLHFKVFETLSPGSHTKVTSNKHVFHWTSQFFQTVFSSRLLLHSFSSNMPYKLQNWIQRVYVWQTKKPQSPVHHFVKKKLSNQSTGGTWWRSWLRHCATSRKVAGSIPNGVVGIFHRHNPSGRIMVLGLTQSLTEMSTRNISWGVKGAGA